MVHSYQLGSYTILGLDNKIHKKGELRRRKMFYIRLVTVVTDLGIVSACLHNESMSIPVIISNCKKNSLRPKGIVHVITKVISTAHSDIDRY